MPADIFGNVPAPSGTITYWDDDPINIPAGWVVCDGNNGTPNLLDEFVKEVPDGSTDPGAVGGQHSFTMAVGQLPSHVHTVTTGTVGSHSHTYYDIFYTDTSSTAQTKGRVSSGSAYSSSTNGGHTHTLSIGSAGGDATIDNRPQYVELVPIMKT